MTGQDDVNRMASIQYAIMVLGHCLVQPSANGTYVLHSLTRRAIHVVRAENGGLVCLTCNSRADEHTAVVTLYRLRWGSNGGD